MNPPAKQETWIWTLGQKDPLEKKMPAHSSVLAGEIPWTEEASFIPWGLKEFRHDLGTKRQQQIIDSWEVAKLVQRVPVQSLLSSP